MAEARRALITGVNGQDGSYLAEFLLSKGYEVHGTIRRASYFNTARIDDLDGVPGFNVHYGDLTDSSNLRNLIRKTRPHEIYNLGAQSHVGVSFELPEYSAEVDAVGTARLLDAIKDSEIQTRFYQASTSELFGGLPGTAPQSESTPFYPKSPYGAAKLYAYWLVVNYREAYNMFACNGILFNHESPRRGENFVTRKITLGIAAILTGKRDKLLLGNLDSKRDWGYAKDYVEAMWLMLQNDTPEDFVAATGVMYTVRDFTSMAFKSAGIELEWRSQGVNETAVDRKTGKTLVAVDPRYFRPAEVEELCGDATKIRTKLGWKPKTTLQELVDMMVKSDLERAGYKA